MRARRQAQQVLSDVSSLSSRVHDARNAAGPLFQQGGATVSNAQQFSGVSGCAGVGCSATGVQNVQMPQQCGVHSVPPTYMGSPANPLLGQQSGSIANEALLPGMMGPSLTAVAQNMQGQSLVDFTVRQMQEMIARLSPLQAQAVQTALGEQMNRQARGVPEAFGQVPDLGVSTNTFVPGGQPRLPLPGRMFRKVLCLLRLRTGTSFQELTSG